MFKLKVVSSLEKLFVDQKIDEFEPLTKLSVLRGERFSFQLAYTFDSSDGTRLHAAARPTLDFSGELFEYSNMRLVQSIPVSKPINNAGTDDNYLRTTPGIYPDVLVPARYNGSFSVAMDILSSAWFEFTLPKDVKAGEYELKIHASETLIGEAEATVKIEVIDAVLPDEDIYVTQWFHADCLANYYNVEVWSDRHWQIVENFAKVARKNGINLLLTPVFTPPLDTAVGGERRTTQLVGVKKTRKGYKFDFTRVGRWIEMCDRCGIEYFEISHLFTQWGAAHAPKIVATVDGEEKKIFGWDTDSTGAEYTAFIRQFLTEFLAYMKKGGNDKRCVFHISDEPSLDHLEKYKAARDSIADLISGYLTIDALSKIDFYKTGAIEHPVPANNHIAPFIEAGVKDLWTYYCVSQPINVSNRYVSMPLWRTRSMGMQMYKYNIVGFLHWGYNFYNDQFSVDPINPYLITAADLTFPAGDSFSVYPACDGTAYESIRIIAFHEGLTDIKAMKLCEKYYGHDAVVAAIEEELGCEMTFETCAKSSKTMHSIRERINSMIKAKI